MIYVTGDTHGDFSRFNTRRFPQQKNMTRDDYVIVCGDFGGVWAKEETPQEKATLDWLASKNFALLFCDGNHENFDRLKTYPCVPFHGGMAHKIRENVYHLMRGHVFLLDGYKFFVFGGARSHDISDGILRMEDYESPKALRQDFARRWNVGQMIRVEHSSWWEDEMPTSDEMANGVRCLKENDWDVDYIITHCAPYHIEQLLYHDCESNILTRYFDDILAHGISFSWWFCGHYHQDRHVNDFFTILYEKMVLLPEKQSEEELCVMGSEFRVPDDAVFRVCKLTSASLLEDGDLFDLPITIPIDSPNVEIICTIGKYTFASEVNHDLVNHT